MACFHVWPYGWRDETTKTHSQPSGAVRNLEKVRRRVMTQVRLCSNVSGARDNHSHLLQLRLVSCCATALSFGKRPVRKGQGNATQRSPRYGGTLTKMTPPW